MNTKAMKSVVIVVFFLLLTGISVAQTGSPTTYNTATFIWNGSTDSSQLVELSTINGQPVNQATGYAGAIQIDGQFLWLLELPESLGFPNNGFLDCETTITFGVKQWDTRADGSQMNGTQAGDSYTLTGTTTCPLWNGTSSVSLTEFHQMIAHRYCNRWVCKTFLADTIENGSGTATVE